MKTATIETAIPFSGFYDSIHSSNLESMLGVSEDDFYVAETEEQKKELEERYNTIDWQTEQRSYCRSYVHEMSKMLGIPLVYKDMQSPREYNFTTDRIFCEIKEEDVYKLQARVNHEKMKELVSSKFTSRDGFISYYSNDYDTWTEDHRNFDHNQIQALIECWLLENEGEEYEIDLMYGCTF